MLNDAKKASINNIIQKLKAGKTATTAELKLIEEYDESQREAEESERSPSSKVPLFTRPQIAKLFNVNPKTVNEWVKVGMPKSAYGRYDIFLIMEWWQENINKDPENAETADARGRYWNAKADEAEIKVAEIRGNLIDKSTVVSEWGKRAGELKQSLMALPMSLPPVLEGKDIKTMRDLIRAEVVKMLEGYCRDGKFCPKKKH